jgi:hypothetical protein
MKAPFPSSSFSNRFYRRDAETRGGTQRRIEAEYTKFESSNFGFAIFPDILCVYSWLSSLRSSAISASAVELLASMVASPPCVSAVQNFPFLRFNL